MPSRTVDKYDLSTRISPGQKAFSLFTRRSNHRPIHGFRLRVMAHRMRNLRRAGPAPWKPLVAISGPAELPVEFDAA